MADRAKLFKSDENQAVHKESRSDNQEEPARRTWSREFLALAGSAPDFPYPDEPPLAELGPG